MRILLLLFGITLAALACQTKPSSASHSAQLKVPAEFYKGLYLYDSTDKIDSAFFYFFNITKSPADSLIRAMSYGYMAEIQQAVGDFLNVQENATAGLKLLNGDTSVNERYCSASLYNNLGRSYVGLKKYDEAIKYYKQALMVPTDNENQNIYRNNIAVALREKGNFKEALDSFLNIPLDSNETKQSFARRTTNLASLKWKADPTFNPLPDLHNALNIRINEKDEFGVTASYNHLSAYYQATSGDSALFYANKMYANAQKTSSVDDRLEALKKMVVLSSATESKRSFGIYEHLRDSVQTNQNNAKNQFAAIRYESEKSKAENLGLQKENAQKELQILRQRIYTYGSMLLALLIVSLAIWRYRKKRQQTKLEAQAAIQENQLKISQRIHDTVANGLYRIMSEIEHKESIEKEPLLDKIEVLYERSRDISYEPVEKEKNTALQISQLLTSFATPDTKISVVGNNEDLWQGIPSMIVKELEQVLQELMVNMKKHSGAHHVVLQFSKSNNHLDISYKDDGKGFPANFSKGNGLKSTGNRINRIGGKITFAEETATGADIKILIPILSNDQKSINS